MNGVTACPWTERVSAELYGELPEAETALVRAHRRTCATCAALAAAGARPAPTAASWIPAAHARPAVRLLLAAAGGLLVVAAAASFVRSTGADVASLVARHLAMWQASLGIAAVTGAIRFRFSRIVTVMLATFVGLTATATVHSEAVEGSADDVVAHAGEVLDLATADQNDRVLLKIVPLARNVGDDLLAVCETNLGDLAESGVGFFGGAGHDLHAHAAALRAIRQSGRLRLDLDFLASFADELVDCWHSRIVF